MTCLLLQFLHKNNLHSFLKSLPVVLINLVLIKGFHANNTEKSDTFQSANRSRKGFVFCYFKRRHCSRLHLFHNQLLFILNWPWPYNWINPILSHYPEKNLLVLIGMTLSIRVLLLFTSVLVTKKHCHKIRFFYIARF